MTTTEMLRAKYALGTVSNEIVEERWRQEEKFSDGQTCANPLMMNGEKMLVLMEEVGEVARAVLEKEPTTDLRKELIQVAAVAAAWAESLTEFPEQ